MCIILIMIVIKNFIIFLINSSSPSHCRIKVTGSVFFIKYFKQLRAPFIVLT